MVRALMKEKCYISYISSVGKRTPNSNNLNILINWYTD